MQVNKTQSIKQPFVLTPDDLQKLDAKLRRHKLKPEFEFECSDGLQRKVSILKGLLDYENPPNRSIKRLSVRAYSDNYKRSVHLTFGGDLGSYIHLMITSDDEDSALKLLQDIEERVTGMRPWYAPIARFDFLIVALLFMTSVWLIASIASVYVKPAPSQTTVSPGQIALGIGVIFTAYVLPILLGLLLNRIKDWAFPKAAFLIGQGEKRFKNKDLARIVLFASFLINLAASLVIALLPFVFR
jgi:hypothetical protein